MIPVIPGRTREVLLRPSLALPGSGLDQNDGRDGALRFIRTHSRSNITGNNAAGKGVGPESRWSEHTRARHEHATLSPTRSPWRARRPGDALQTATTTCPAKCSYRPPIPSPCSFESLPGELSPHGATNFPPGGIKKSQLCYFLIGQKAHVLNSRTQVRGGNGRTGARAADGARDREGGGRGRGVQAWGGDFFNAPDLRKSRQI